MPAKRDFLSVTDITPDETLDLLNKARGTKSSSNGKDSGKHGSGSAPYRSHRVLASRHRHHYRDVDSTPENDARLGDGAEATAGRLGHREGDRREVSDCAGGSGSDSTVAGGWWAACGSVDGPTGS